MTRTSTLPVLPALVVGWVHHTRHRPFEHSFTYRHYQWLIDLDGYGRLPWWLRHAAAIRGEDHLQGRPGAVGIRNGIVDLAAAHGVDRTHISRVVMLAHARVLGHAFDPMTAYWCLDAAGEQVCVVIEVHNTYGGRHTYVLFPDERGRAEVDKSFFVSPFNDVEGTYAISEHLSARQVAVAIRLTVDDAPLLTASVAGVCRPATPKALLGTMIRLPLMPQRVSALIRVQGIWLWLRGLPLRGRPAATTTWAGVR